MKEQIQDKFKYGQISSILDQNIPIEAASRAESWFTRGERIELRRGSTRLGLTELVGSGKVTGSIVATKADGTEVYFRSRGTKVEYYIPSTDEFGETGTDIIPAAAANEVITFDSISDVTGPQVWLNSPNTGLIKIMVANPESYSAMYDGTKNFRGYISIKGSAIWLWNAVVDNKIPDLVNIYRSYLSNKAASDYTQISGESVGSSGSITYTGTLAFRSGHTTRTALEVTFTDTSETFIDDLSGNLIGSAGGTGTINYTTGVYVVNFHVVAVGSVTATYRWVDTNSTGISDFTFSGTRTSGQGVVLRQGDNGSPIMNVKSFGGKYYVFHRNITWVVSISVDDLSFTNLIYRNNVGIPSIYGAVESENGVYYIDVSDSNDPQIKKLSFDTAGVEVVSQPVSKAFKLNGQNVGIDLTPYTFDETHMMRFGNLITVACKSDGTDFNNILHVFNQDSKSIDVMSGIYAQTQAIYGGAIVIGESISNNSIIIFSGSDDQEDTIYNFWEGKNDNLDMERLKNVKNLVIEGEIGPNQKIRAYIADDRGAFVEILDENGGAFIDGTGSYVDRTQRVTIGPVTMGTTEIGGGGDGIEAYHFERQLKINADKFQYRKLRFAADGIGWAAISKYIHRDIRVKWQKLPNKYRQ